MTRLPAGTWPKFWMLAQKIQRLFRLGPETLRRFRIVRCDLSVYAPSRPRRVG